MAGIAAVESKSFSSRIFVVGVVLIVLVLAGVIMAAKPKQGTGHAASAAQTRTASYPAGALTARDADFDFGSISMAAGNVSHRYWFTNTSAAPVLIGKITTSCMCTTAMLVKGGRVINRYGMPGHGFTPSVNESIAPNEEALVEVVFDPAAHGPAGIGPTERFVTIESDAGQPLELRFTALVRP